MPGGGNEDRCFSSLLRQDKCVHFTLTAFTLDRSDTDADIRHVLINSKLWRYATRTEIVLNLIGLIAAIAAGAAQPLMTIAFSGLTTSFTRWGSEVIALQNGTGTLESFNAARDRLYSDTNQNVLYLVYIGIASFAATYIFMAAFQHTGETNTRRVREAYLAAVLRQNLAYFDAVGAGEVTTRIENDTHLLQEGISE